MMIKKVLAGAIAAGALSVPLAGVAWAEPASNPDAGGSAVGEGGIPEKLGDFLESDVTPNANPNGPDGGPVTVGSIVKGLTAVEGNVPDALGEFETGLWSTHVLLNGEPIQTVWGTTPPGLAIKPLTPGCSHGRSAITDPASVRCVG
jgi:hypothetical protein